MKIQNSTFNYIQNPSFQKNKGNPDMKKEVKTFKVKCHFIDQERNSFGRIWHFINVFLCVGFLYYTFKTTQLSEFIVSGGGILVHLGLDKLFHNIAMRKSQLLVKMLKHDDKDEEFIYKSVDYYLKKNGGIVYSNFVRKFKKGDIKKIVDGENAPQLKGLVPFIQTKLAIFSNNEALKVKGRRNFKKYLHIK